MNENYFIDMSQKLDYLSKISEEILRVNSEINARLLKLIDIREDKIKPKKTSKNATTKSKKRRK